MPEVKDDPRQVLALLNSLGFVGITAEQLRAFMKGRQKFNGFSHELGNLKIQQNVGEIFLLKEGIPCGQISLIIFV